MVLAIFIGCACLALIGGITGVRSARRAARARSQAMKLTYVWPAACPFYAWPALGDDE